MSATLAVRPSEMCQKGHNYSDKYRRARNRSGSPLRLQTQLAAILEKFPVCGMTKHCGSGSARPDAQIGVRGVGPSVHTNKGAA